MKRTLNFDRFIEEKEEEPIVITVLGRKYNVPPRIPAIVPVMMARAEEDMTAAETSKLVLRAADAMYGKKAVDQMCEDGLRTEELGLLVQKTFAAINGEEEEEDEEQELSDADSRRSISRSKPKK